MNRKQENARMSADRCLSLISEKGKPQAQEAEVPPRSGADAAALTTEEGRADLVREIRGMVGDRFKDDWRRRCADVAGFALHALRSLGVTSYRIAAGRVDETTRATAKTGKAPRVRYEGVLSEAGRQSEYHVWLIDDSTGHKIDCSELPYEQYGHHHLWEPSETVPELDYIERAEITAAMGPRIMRNYRLELTAEV
jgi:hypothetical protein